MDVIGAEMSRDVEPGVIVVIDRGVMKRFDYAKFKHHYMCAREYVYFARPDSDIECTNVHAYRKESGRLLYQESPADADIVIVVPDSSLSAAMGYSDASDSPSEFG